MFAVVQREGPLWHVAFYRQADGRLWKLHGFSASWFNVAAELVGLLGSGELGSEGHAVPLELGILAGPRRGLPQAGAVQTESPVASQAE